MNRKNREMIAACNDLCDEIKARVKMCCDVDEINDVVAEYRPKLLEAIQEIIDYNAIDYIVMDPDSHIITDHELPDWYYAVANPRHMAWTDKELKKELEEKGFASRSLRCEGRWDD